MNRGFETVKFPFDLLAQDREGKEVPVGEISLALLDVEQILDDDQEQYPDKRDGDDDEWTGRAG